MDLVMAIGRSRLYSVLSGIFYFLEKGNREEALALMNTLSIFDEDAKEKLDDSEIKDLRGASLRKDLADHLMRVYPMIVEEFYANSGYSSSELSPDHLAVMLAFVGKLTNDEVREMQIGNDSKVRELRIVEYRFIKNHLLKLLEDSDSKLLKLTYDLIRNDASLLYRWILKTQNQKRKNLATN